MSDEPPRKSFWQWMGGDQAVIATIMACSLGVAVCILAIFAGFALIQHKYELNGSIADMFKMILSAIAGSLGTYIGVKKNGEPK